MKEGFLLAWSGPMGCSTCFLTQPCLSACLCSEGHTSVVPPTSITSQTKASLMEEIPPLMFPLPRWLVCVRLTKANQHTSLMWKELGWLLELRGLLDLCGPLVSAWSRTALCIDFSLVPIIMIISCRKSDQNHPVLFSKTSSQAPLYESKKRKLNLRWAQTLNKVRNWCSFLCPI